MVIRNITGTIKEIIKFYCESTLQRKLYMPPFSEPRWCSKYKSIRLFSESFISIIQSLQYLSINGFINSNKR